MRMYVKVVAIQAAMQFIIIFIMVEFATGLHSVEKVQRLHPLALRPRVASNNYTYLRIFLSHILHKICFHYQEQ